MKLSLFVLGIVASGTAFADAPAKKKLPRVPMTEITGTEVLSYASTALGKKYIWGGTVWNSSVKGKGDGPDCSGLVLKAWRFPKALKASEPLPIKQKWDIGGVLVQPRQDTRTMYAGEFAGVKLPWVGTKDYSQAVPGDAIVWKGHTMLVWNRDNKAKTIRTIEAIGGDIRKTAHLVRTDAFLESKATKLIKRDRMKYGEAPYAAAAPNKEEQAKAGDVSRPTSSSTSKSKPTTSKPKSKPEAASTKTPVTKVTAAYHTVVKGDSYFGIARKYGVTMGHIFKLNPGTGFFSKIGIGQKIRVR